MTQKAPDENPRYPQPIVLSILRQPLEKNTPPSLGDLRKLDGVETSYQGVVGEVLDTVGSDAVLLLVGYDKLSSNSRLRSPQVVQVPVAHLAPLPEHESRASGATYKTWLEEPKAVLRGQGYNL